MATASAPAPAPKKARQVGETGNRLFDEALAAPMLSIVTTGVPNGWNVTARPVAGTWGPG
jgi:hypothetical protein